MLTQRMIDICELVGIKLLDSIIVGGDNREYFSFKEKNRMPIPHRNIVTDYQQVEFKVPVAAEISSYLDGDNTEPKKGDLKENKSHGGRKR